MRYLLIVFLLICQNLSAQVDSSDIFGNFPYSDSIDYSYVHDIQCIGDYYYFMVLYIYKKDEISVKTQYPSIIKTDMNFNVIERLDTVKVNNVIQRDIDDIIYIDEKEGYALLTGHQYKENKTLYNVFKLDLQTLEVQKTDSIELPSNELLGIFTYKQVNDTTLASFGQLQPVEIAINDNYIFTAVSTSGKVMRFQELDLLFREKSILGFEYLEKSGLYFLNIPSEDYYVYDMNLNLIQQVDAELHALGGLSNVTLSSRFIEAENGYIHCIGRIPAFGRQYSLTHLRLPIIGDSIGEIDQADPLLEGNNVLAPEYAIPAVDEEGNVLVVLDDQFSFPGQDAIDTTTLYILKTNLEDYGYRSNEWFISYRNDTEMSVWAADADKNGDFIIAGAYYSEEFYGETRNFYLKVQSDGTITSTKGPVPDDIMVVYPNPTYGSVFLKSDDQSVHSYSVYSVQGRLIKQDEIISRGKFEMNEMGAGTYFLIFKDRNGEVVGKSKVVKY